MKFTIATLVTLAMSAAAMPSTNGKPKTKEISFSQAAGLCTVGEVSCCNPKKEISGNGVLGNLLAEGLLNNLIGTGDSACTSVSLIKNLNILGITKEAQEGTTCTSVIACCPAGQDCTAIKA
ncbi:Hydrophobin [Penicillium griseofulvum]|uniref:Hydrophobin n=1 Tax=Penicillium patulum TaxID=5078 RepID=A0A135LCU7_PENPA|nr:Hydrophobin [Penicillium griseofulvum]KXG46794.1 Hydrophobin [Penicillium griseofulvum]